MGAWIGQEWQKRKKLDERARPPHGSGSAEYRARVWPAHRQVDTDAVEVGAKLVDRVQRAFLCAPIELVDPIRKQLFEVVKMGSLQALPGA